MTKKCRMEVPIPDAPVDAKLLVDKLTNMEKRF